MPDGGRLTSWALSSLMLKLNGQEAVFTPDCVVFVSMCLVPLGRVYSGGGRAMFVCRSCFGEGVLLVVCVAWMVCVCRMSADLFVSVNGGCAGLVVFCSYHVRTCL